MLPSDREEVPERYESLSAETREHRFLASVPHLTDAMLDHLVDEVDGIDHVALALVVIGADNVGRSVGVARMIRYRNEPEAADVAVTVDDAWQGRGVATALLSELLRVRTSPTRRRPEVLRRRLRSVHAAPPDDAGPVARWATQARFTVVAPMRIRASR